MPVRNDDNWRRELIKDLVVATVPVIISEIGEGIREWLEHRRETCPHGRYKGALCVHCSDCGRWKEENGDGKGGVDG